MKPQDIAFIAVTVILLLLRNAMLCIITGIACFLLAIPLFARWIFFTGERLTWYGAALVFVGIMFMLFAKEKHV